MMGAFPSSRVSLWGGPPFTLQVMRAVMAAE